VYISLPAAAAEPSKRLVGFEKVDLMPGESKTLTVTVDSSAPNHPLSFFDPDARGTWSDGNWLTPQGNYTVYVGTSSTDTPLAKTVNLDVPASSFSLQVLPEPINLTNKSGRVITVLRVAEPFSLFDLHLTDIRFEGAPVLEMGYSPDGRVMVAVFENSKLSNLTAGNKIVALTADTEKQGIKDRLWVTSTATVQK
jgi:hypothetical protein